MICRAPVGDRYWELAMKLTRLDLTALADFAREHTRPCPSVKSQSVCTWISDFIFVIHLKETDCESEQMAEPLFSRRDLASIADSNSDNPHVPYTESLLKPHSLS